MSERGAFAPARLVEGASSPVRTHNRSVSINNHKRLVTAWGRG